MNDNEREMDLALAEAEQENRLLRARNERLERELAGQVALDKMAEDARTIGLRLDDWDKIGCVNHDCDKCKAAALDNGGMTGVEQDERVFARIEAMKKPAAQPVPVQEPVAEYRGVTNDGHYIIKPMQPLKIGALFYTAPPAAQPVPVKTYHDGKPWPVAPKPWVGLSEDEINKLRHLVDWTAEWSYGRFAYELERLLREKNT
jgi:hypothetical protein